MAKVHELGYVGISAGDLDEWRAYATTILGHEVAHDSDGESLFLKMDGHHHRLSVHPGEAEDVTFVGWEVGSAENMETRQFRTRPRSPSRGSLAGSGERPSTASGVITMFAKVPGPCNRRPPFIASPSNLPTSSVGNVASFTKMFIRRPDTTSLMWFHPFSRSGARV